MSRKKPLIYWGKSRLVFSHNLNHDQFCNTVDIQVIVSGHVETVVLFGKRTDDPKDYVKIGLDVENYYKIKDIQNKQLVE